MTDETRPDSGRMPSDSTEVPERPEFRPAGETTSPSGGNGWGDPSGRPRDTIVFGGPTGSGADAPPPSGPAFDAPPPSGPAFDAPAPGASSAPPPGPSPTPAPGSSMPAPGSPAPAPGFSAPAPGSSVPSSMPSFSPPSGPSFSPPSGPPPHGGYGGQNGNTGQHTVSGQHTSGPYAPQGSGQHSSQSTGDTGQYATVSGNTGTHPQFGSPAGNTGQFGSPAGNTGPYGTQGGSGSGGGNVPPPPPGRPLGMGAGWAPPPGAASTAGPSRGPGVGVLVAIGVVIAMVSALAASAGTYLMTRDGSDTNPNYSLGPVPTGSTNRPPDSVAGVAARVLPSVVSLEVGNGNRTEGASGSGFLIKGGYVVTNHHVVAMAVKGGEINIIFNNRKESPGRIVGTDPGSDLAVIKPDNTFGTPEIALGNSDDVVVGDPVLAVGTPLGLTGTVTTGIVSSKNRPVVAGSESARTAEDVAYISAIQTDAAINPGNSGGPLVNANGEVVGVNSAIATLSRVSNSEQGNIGLGFAITSNQTRRVAEDLIKYGKARKPLIGIVIDPGHTGEGVRIASDPAQGRQPVTKDGPAAKAGLKGGDVILEVDGLRLENDEELIALVRSKAPGSKLNVKYVRDGQEKTATLTVEADAEPVATPTPS
ncbi:S1C family serine protease [Nonomuraea sp. NPDC050663]|uniref:S1C family serine protease n=1 Tax=Nonomuraea sp. NPDC050663 TaxID=3364370 RepID=UPI0037B9B0D6